MPPTFLYGYNKLDVRQSFFLHFNDSTAREEHKIIYNGLRITEMDLSNQNDFFVVPDQPASLHRLTESIPAGLFKSLKIRAVSKNLLSET